VPELELFSRLELHGAVLDHCCGDGYIVEQAFPGRILDAGVDLSDKALDSARRRGNYTHLEQADAGSALPFASGSFGTVLNNSGIEHIADLARAVAEVARVLHPGGHFLYTDLRARHLIADWESAIAEAPMGLRSERIVNAEVLRAIEKNSHWSLNLLDRHLPAFLRSFGREFAVTQGSRVYRDLQRGELSFRMYWLAKD